MFILNIIFLVILIENGMTEKLVYRIVKLISNIKCQVESDPVQLCIVVCIYHEGVKTMYQ